MNFLSAEAAPCQALEALGAGDRIIASGYDSFNDLEELKLSETVSTEQVKA